MGSPPKTKLVTTIDFHVTSECNMECPYCWGPQDFEHPVDTATARKIITNIKRVGASRIVFTGGDPLLREDITQLIHHARSIGLEVALSTTGDELKLGFLSLVGEDIDLISLPLDGSSEDVNSQTKEKDQFAAVVQALEWLKGYPRIDVKIATPVTRYNLVDVPNVLGLVENYARTTEARVFYNIFQAFPRSMDKEVEWDQLTVTDDEFRDLKRLLKDRTDIKVNFLDHEVLDKLYVMIFPDGNLVVPSGGDFLTYGPFLEVKDLDQALKATDFDSPKHLRHSKGWSKVSSV
jgi:MoaA/NifB/PqqE/SkfB family radical SAM enzyme